MRLGQPPDVPCLGNRFSSVPGRADRPLGAQLCGLANAGPCIRLVRRPLGLAPWASALVLRLPVLAGQAHVQEALHAGLVSVMFRAV